MPLHNTVADHVTVLDAAVVQLPPAIAAGHHVGDDPSLVGRAVVVRADSAGCTEGFLGACMERNIGFFVTVRSNTQLTGAIFEVVGLEDVWEPTLTQDGEPREGAAVCEVTSLISTPKLPDGTRCIIRREPLHPGAQRSLFPALDYRYWGFYTDQDGDPVALDATMRAHAHVEQHICRLKDSGVNESALTGSSSSGAIISSRYWPSTSLTTTTTARIAHSTSRRRGPWESRDHQLTSPI